MGLLKVDQNYVHPAVQREADVLRDATGHEPELTRLDHNRWRIVMDSDRVHMFVDYRVASRGRLHWTNSALAIDGQRVERAGSIEQFAAIFKDPDQAGNRSAAPNPEMLPLAAEGDAPDLVRSAYTKLVQDLPDAEVVIGNEGTAWAIQIINGPVVLRVHYRAGISGAPGRRRGVRCRPVTRHPFTIIVDGTDRTAEFEGNLERAMALLSGTPGEDHQSAPSVRAEASPAHSNAVRVRKQSVMRI